MENTGSDTSSLNKTNNDVLNNGPYPLLEIRHIVNTKAKQTEDTVGDVDSVNKSST